MKCEPSVGLITAYKEAFNIKNSIWDHECAKQTCLPLNHSKGIPYYEFLVPTSLYEVDN